MIVSGELIRVAILWHELWHEGLEEASRLYFTEKNADGMIAVLEPLHEMLEAVSSVLFPAGVLMTANTSIRDLRLPVRPHSHRSLEENCTKLVRRAVDIESTVIRPS